MYQQTWWERVVLAGVCAFAFVLAAAATYKVFLSEEAAPPSSDVLGEAAPIEGAQSSAEELAQPERAGPGASAGPAARPPATPSLVRRDCEELRRSGPANAEETQWLLGHCQKRQQSTQTDWAALLQSLGSSAGEPASEPRSPAPPELGPDAAPPPPVAVPDAEPTLAPPATAIALALTWLRGGGSPVVYDVDASSCGATRLNHWVVTCRVTLAGCAVTGCERSVTVCVDIDPAAVRPAEHC